MVDELVIAQKYRALRVRLIFRCFPGSCKNPESHILISENLTNHTHSKAIDLRSWNNEIVKTMVVKTEEAIEEKDQEAVNYSNGSEDESEAEFSSNASEDDSSSESDSKGSSKSSSESDSNSSNSDDDFESIDSKENSKQDTESSKLKILDKIEKILVENKKMQKEIKKTKRMVQKLIELDEEEIARMSRSFIQM